jgi:hypothetical protein
MKSSLDVMSEEDYSDHPLQESETTTKTTETNARASRTTSPTDTGSFSGEESFFEAIGSDFRTLALTLKATAGGVANFVHRSAMSVAAEISRLENDDNNVNELDQTSDHDQLRLPWEVRTSSTTYEEDAQLREKILSLSSDEDAFLQPFARETNEDDLDFTMDEPRIQLIRRLLAYDENLSVIHARLSGRSYVHEKSFWKNYFSRCEEERQAYLKQFETDFQSLSSQNSLVPTEREMRRDDDSSSFVIPSPPTSGWSVDSLVIVESVKLL